MPWFTHLKSFETQKCPLQNTLERKKGGKQKGAEDERLW